MPASAKSSITLRLLDHAEARWPQRVEVSYRGAGTPQEALDTACVIHLAGLGHEPDP